MKKLIVGLFLVGGIILSHKYIMQAPKLVENQVESISGMDHNKFEKFINEKHYLVKSWALDSTDASPETLDKLNKLLNFQTTTMNIISKKIKEFGK